MGTCILSRLTLKRAVRARRSVKVGASVRVRVRVRVRESLTTGFKCV